ncbi:MAG: VWA domain-containing protein [Candidatus Gracilibacteria bacterium]|nr:VWA domain-containing protein [Candidatus Gracilibacteria bacterium]
MEITNFNFYTFIVFIILFLVVGFLFYKKITSQISFNKDYKLLASKRYFFMKYIFLFLSFFFVLVSIFGIKYGEKAGNSELKGVDIIFTLDVSKSMNVADFNDDNYYYTRLQIAKKSISEFAIKHPENRYGLVIFAGEAVSAVPLTEDNDLFLTLLDGVDYKNLVKQGSNFLSAISLGIGRFTDENRSKVMIFLSDGGDSDDKIDYDGIKNISTKNPGINYFVVGIGTNNGGKIINGQDVFGRINYQTYNGEEVVSKLEIANLKKISSALSAKFTQVKNLGDMLNLNNDIEKLNKTIIKKGTSGELADASRKLSIIGLIFFMLFLLFYFLNDKLGKKF